MGTAVPGRMATAVWGGRGGRWAGELCGRGAWTFRTGWMLATPQMGLGQSEIGFMDGEKRDVRVLVVKAC